MFAAIQLVTFLAINTANWRFVNQQIETDLEVAEHVFERFMQQRVEQLMLNARLLSDDFAFKQAYASGDRDTLHSALLNLQRHRIGADIMTIVDAVSYTVITSTSRVAEPNAEFSLPSLIEAAERTGRPSAAIKPLSGRFHSLAVVPLLAPEPVAWVIVGFLIDDELAEELKRLTLTDVSFLEKGNDRRVLASTLPESVHSALRRSITAGGDDSGNLLRWAAQDKRFVALTMAPNARLLVLLQRSLDEALAPFQQSYRILLLLAGIAVALSAAGSALIARTVARPVRTLVEEAGRIEKGDYRHQIEIDQKDEIGRLAEAFNQMTRGLAAFHRYLPMDLVRTLLTKGIESRPETRIATILFTDIENFTTLVEHQSPEHTVVMLNDYFSAVTVPIEEHGGVITQFQGDAVLAVFNVPTDDPEHAIHAVRAALEIHRAVKAQTFAGITLNNRVGINTGVVVAGSVGSKNRVNYTVHGDAVNIAARLEMLNKDYGTRVLVSQATMEMVGNGIPAERIGEIEIRGKRQTVGVYKLA